MSRKSHNIPLIIFLLLLGVGLFGCKSKPTSDTSPTAWARPTSAALPSLAESTEKSRKSSEQLTSVGQNSQASFSWDGRKIVFVSRDRPAHRNQQLYELSLLTGKERRITYSDGDAENPQFFNDDDHLIYISNTDALKERPTLFLPTNETPKNFSDLYGSDLIGLQIERLTTIESHISQASLDANTFNEIVFATSAGNNSGLFKIGIHGGIAQQILSSQEAVLSFPLRIADHILVWLQTDPKTLLSVVKSRKGPKQEVTWNLPPMPIHDISWWDAKNNLILVSGKFSETTKYSLFIFDLKKECLMPILKTEGDLIEGSVAPDRQSLVYTSGVQGQRQIFWTFTPQPLPECRPLPGVVPPALKPAADSPVQSPK